MSIKAKTNDELLAMAKGSEPGKKGRKKGGKKSAGAGSKCGELSQAIGVVRHAATMIHDAGIRVQHAAGAPSKSKKKTAKKKTTKKAGKRRSKKAKA